MALNDNALMARFESVPTFVESGMESVVQAALVALTSHPRAGEMLAVTKASADTFWYQPDDWRAQFRPYEVKDGILHIPVKGVLMHDFPWSVGCYATGYAYIWQALVRGLDDSEVKGIAFIINSPGGEVAGCFDMVDKAVARRGEKPMRAFAHESAYSAAYAVATIADRIDVSKTGGVGSIGVVTFHTDYSGMLEKSGIKRTYVYAGAHKVDGNPTEPLPDAVKARWQVRINETYGVFVSTVARNRGLDEAVIRATEAATFTATQAVENRLADAIGSLDDQLAAFAVDLSNDEGVEVMSTTDTSAANQAAIDTARADGLAEGTLAGATAAKSRIDGILACDAAAKRPKAALSAALKTEMSVEQANAFLADLSEETVAAATTEATGAGVGNRFDAAMTGTKNPNIDADGGDEQEVSASSRILSTYFGDAKS